MSALKDILLLTSFFYFFIFLFSIFKASENSIITSTLYLSDHLFKTKCQLRDHTLAAVPEALYIEKYTTDISKYTYYQFHTLNVSDCKIRNFGFSIPPKTLKDTDPKTLNYYEKSFLFAELLIEGNSISQTIPIRFILTKLRTTQFMWLYVAFIVLLFYRLIHPVFLRLGIFFKKCMLIIRDCKDLEDALCEVYSLYKNGDGVNSNNDIDNNNNFNIQSTDSENNITSNRNLNKTGDNSNTSNNVSNDTETSNTDSNTNKASRSSEYSGASGSGGTSGSVSTSGISGVSDSSYETDADNNIQDTVNITSDDNIGTDEDTNLRDSNSSDDGDQADSTHSDTSSGHGDENSDVASQIKYTVPHYKGSKIPIPQSFFNNNQSSSLTEKAKPIRTTSALQEYINHQTLGRISEDEEEQLEEEEEQLEDEEEQLEYEEEQEQEQEQEEQEQEQEYEKEEAEGEPEEDGQEQEQDEEQESEEGEQENAEDDEKSRRADSRGQYNNNQSEEDNSRKTEDNTSNFPSRFASTSESVETNIMPQASPQNKSSAAQSSMDDQNYTISSSGSFNDNQPKDNTNNVFENSDTSSVTSDFEQVEVFLKNAHSEKLEHIQYIKNRMSNLPCSPESSSLDMNFLEKKYYYEPDGRDNLYDGPEEIAAKLGFNYKKPTEDGTASSSNSKESVKFYASTTVETSATVTAESSATITGASTASDQTDTTALSSNSKGPVHFDAFTTIEPPSITTSISTTNIPTVLATNKNSITIRSSRSPDSPYISPLLEKATPSWPFNYLTLTPTPALAPERARVPIPPTRNIHFPDEVYNHKSIEEAELAIIETYEANNRFPSDASKSRKKIFPEVYLSKTAEELAVNVVKASSIKQHNHLKQETESEPSGSTSSVTSNNDSSNDSSKVKDDIVVNVTVSTNKKKKKSKSNKKKSKKSRR